MFSLFLIDWRGYFEVAIPAGRTSDDELGILRRAATRLEPVWQAAVDEARATGGAVLHGPRLFSQPTCHHAPEVYPGIGEEEAGAMLRGFFRERRG